MAVPKQKQSKSRTRRRRSHQALKKKQLIKCSHCGQPKLNHVICINCGYYKGRPVVKIIKEKSSSKKKTAKKQKDEQ